MLFRLNRHPWETYPPRFKMHTGIFWYAHHTVILWFLVLMFCVTAAQPKSTIRPQLSGCCMGMGLWRNSNCSLPYFILIIHSVNTMPLVWTRTRVKKCEDIINWTTWMKTWYFNIPGCLEQWRNRTEVLCLHNSFTFDGAVVIIAS